MPWQIGIDEAGYGPNLGPFVMTLVAARVPDHDACLWDLLKPCVRRFDDEADERLIVADSKQVYSPASGWLDLERSVLAGMPKLLITLQKLIERLSPDDLPGLKQESWYVGDTALPTEVDGDHLASCRKNWHKACKSVEVDCTFCRSVVMPAPRFNDLIDKWDSKGAVLGVALTSLIEHCMRTLPEEPMRFTIDKHGGRNNYSALLQHAFPDGFVIGEVEGAARSVYRVEGLGRDVRVTFMPKADVTAFPVALASMVSKYVRELMMREFNRYWLTHVPGLAPTAGYPGDALRFFEAIRPVLAKLSIAERAVWRMR
jgi:ribonuclease HII